MVYRQGCRRVCRTIAALAVCAGPCAAPAHAGVLSLAIPETLASPVAMADPAIALPDLPDLALAAQASLGTFENVFNARLTDNILSSIGSLARARAPLPKPGTPSLRDAFAATPPSPGLAPGLAMLANPTFGAREGVAVSVAQRLVPTGPASAGINTDVRISHADDRLDAGFALSGQQNFTAPDPMAISYDGHALVSVSPAMQFGLAARGTLGTVSTPALNGAETAGPLFHLNLISRNLSLVSDVGYDFGLNPTSAMARSQLHMKMALKIKL